MVVLQNTTLHVQKITLKVNFYIYSPSHIIQMTFFKIYPWILQGKVWNLHKILNYFCRSYKHKNYFWTCIDFCKISTKWINIGNLHVKGT